MKTTGKVVGPTSRTRKTTTVQIEVPVEAVKRLLVGSEVTVTTSLSDEMIGQRLRALLTFDPPGLDADNSVQSLATEVSDYSGWPGLGELISDVYEDIKDAS